MKGSWFFAFIVLIERSKSLNITLGVDQDEYSNVCSDDMLGTHCKSVMKKEYEAAGFDIPDVSAEQIWPDKIEVSWIYHGLATKFRVIARSNGTEVVSREIIREDVNTTMYQVTLDMPIDHSLESPPNYLPNVPPEAYQISVSACTVSACNDSDDVAVFPNSTKVADVAAQQLQPGKVLVTWRNTWPAMFFLITARSNGTEQVSMETKWGKPRAAEHSVILDIPIHYTPDNPSNYFPDMLSEVYWISVSACASGVCSISEDAPVHASSIRVPTPFITAASANEPRSFEVSWDIPDKNLLRHVNFIVHYCTDVGPCREVITVERKFYAYNLKPSTSYLIEVRAQLTHEVKMPRLGRAAQATVTTWSDVPAEPWVNPERIESRKIVYSWEFTNSIVEHVEVSKDGGLSWINCTTMDDCTIDVTSWSRLSHDKGYLTITKLKPYTEYAVSVRGCNAQGCGEEHTVPTRTRVSAPSEPLFGNITELLNVFAQVTWNLPVEANGPLSGFYVNWMCDPEERFLITVEETRAIIEDYRNKLGVCDIRVAAFNTDEDGETFVGKWLSITESEQLYF